MTRKPGRSIRLIKRILVIGILVFVGFFMVAFGVFSYYKDDIARKLLLRANTIQPGEIKFENISFNPFVHFPGVSLELNNLEYYEKTATFRKTDSLPIIELNHLYLAVNVLDLIRGNVNVSKIRLETGKLRLVSYADSTVNLLNAIGLSSDTIKREGDSTQDRNEDFKLDLEKITISNIAVRYENTPQNTKSDFLIRSVSSSFNFWPDTIKCKLHSDILLENFSVTKNLKLENKYIILSTAFVFNRNLKEIRLEPSRFSFEGANFTTLGYIGLGEESLIDLTFHGDDKDFNVLDFFLSVNGVKHIKEGSLFFTGSIKGPLSRGIPEIKCNFGLNDVQIQIPETNESINSLNLHGDFNSGLNADLTNAELVISQLTADMPGGKLNGSFSVHDFDSPNIDVDFYLKTEITGFDEIFRIESLDSLSGKLELRSKLSGQYDALKGKMLIDEGIFIVRFDSVSALIPEVNWLKNIYGRLKFLNDTAHFKDFAFDLGKSDFKINGFLTNVLHTFFEEKKEINGDLNIKAGVYDFPDFFSWDQRTANAFQYRIKNVNLFVKPKTTTSNLKNFVAAPRINFNIHHLDAEIENFLPPVTIRKGDFLMGDKDSSLLLNFNDFDIELLESKLDVNMEYQSPLVDPDWFTVDLKASGINPEKTFVHWFNDSVQEFLSGNLNGNFHLDMVLSNDSLIQFDKVDLQSYTLDFINNKDTFDVHNMRLNTRNVAYDLSSSPNFLETLSFEMDLTIDTFATNYFKLDLVDDNIIAEDGIFRIIPRNSQFFDKLADGNIVLKPFTEPPSYEFQYSVEQFDVATLFDAFLEDTVLLGKMDIDLKIILAGEGWEEVKKNLEGSINVYGQDLTLLGLDLDKLIERFKRSQRFTFADLGAVLLMGPAGILVTKGSDYARIIVLNHGESSHIRELSSVWEIKNGKIDLTDVAFSTDENRMAAKGGIDLVADTLKLRVALVNEQGCSVFDQRISGSLKDPEMGKVRVVKSLFAPVTNLVKSSNNCDVFYNGIVKQPIEE